MPVYKWDGAAYRDLKTGDTVTPTTDPAFREGWGLPVFRDDFTGDLSQWNVRNNFSTIDTARAMTANTTIEDGTLHLKGKWLTTPATGGPRGIYTHTTGYVDTRALVDTANPTPVYFAQQWGRWEIRAQVPTGPNTLGALAAFWLRNEGGKLGEIDIFESWGGASTMPNKAEYDTWVYGSAVTTFHNNTNGSGAPLVNGKGYRKAQFRHWQSGVPRTLWEGMHTYAFERMPDYMAMYVDDIQVFRVTPTTTDPNNAADTLWWLWDEDFYGSPLHMRINLHIGPNENYYGLPDPDNRQLTTEPLDFAIEHVYAYAPEVI